MSIAKKILLGCLSLTSVTIVFGLLAWSAQAELGTIAFRIYDEAFMSMSYLRSAQNTVVVLSRDLALGRADPAKFAEQIASATGDLQVAHDRAMSKQGVKTAGRLQQDVAALGHDIERTHALPPPQQIEAIEDSFDEAVEVYAGDGYRARRAVTALVRQTMLHTWIAMGASLGIALLITIVLSRAILPSLRHAVGIATAIANGRLDNRIDGRGRSETGTLMRALATMQGSIAEKIARIHALMAEQASHHASETAQQHARFEAALNNMVQGLCMFDAGGRVLVHNHRFAEMFGTPPEHASAADALPPGLLGEEMMAGHARNSRSFSQALGDGRTISVAQEPMPDGGWVATFEDVTERHRAEARLTHMARHDALTGLPNRVFYRELMERPLAQVRRDGGLAVLCLGLDHFKTVNDSLGHPVGDALLQAVARRLLDITRETDTVVRLGGDEFAVIQSSAIQPTEAKALAERLVASIATPFEVLGHEVAIGASVGIAVTTDGEITPDGLLKCADLAMVRAKVDGRGTYRFFEEEMDARMQARRLLEVDLRQAVVEGQFEVYYQPLVNAGTGEVSSFEALIRWPHPKRGMVSPGTFIPLAEELGLISNIGLWVLGRACADAVTWPEDVKVAVNLSAVQFRNRNLAISIAAALQQSGLPAHRLEVEITESLLLQDSEATLAILHEIHALGVRIAMDDFGTGYSSLSYLRLFPFDKIKIDQSFVRNLGDGDDGLAIIRAVVGLGRALGMGIVAEGVETRQQFDLLRDEGCHQIQGYLVSRPKPVSDVAGIIASNAAPPAAGASQDVHVPGFREAAVSS